jgi:hypothetical protein
MSGAVPGIRIITINTGKCDGWYPERIEWMLSELRRLEPDVIALQEAFRAEEGPMDTAGRLADGLDMDVFWTPARFKCRPLAAGDFVRGWSGMALLARNF